MTNHTTNDYNARIIEKFLANEGRVGGPWAGSTLILIHHIGAKSGIERVTPPGVHADPPGLNSAETRRWPRR